MSATTKFESTFAVPKMDCPSEENMIKMALQGVEGVQSLTFDLPGRKLVAVHRAPVAEVLQRLEPLGKAVLDHAGGHFGRGRRIGHMLILQAENGPHPGKRRKDRNRTNLS